MKRQNLLGLADEGKYKIYDSIGREAKGVKVKEHKDGFPLLTVDWKGVHLLTDCLSLEEWFGKK